MLGWACVTWEEEWGAICFHHIILHLQEMEGPLASSRGLLDQKAGFGGVHFHTLGVYHQGTMQQTGRKTSRQWLGLPPALWEGWGQRPGQNTEGCYCVAEPGTNVGEVDVV